MSILPLEPSQSYREVLRRLWDSGLHHYDGVFSSLASQATRGTTPAPAVTLLLDYRMVHSTGPLSLRPYSQDWQRFTLRWHSKLANYLRGDLANSSSMDIFQCSTCLFSQCTFSQSSACSWHARPASCNRLAHGVHSGSDSGSAKEGLEAWKGEEGA